MKEKGELEKNAFFDKIGQIEVRFIICTTLLECTECKQSFTTFVFCHLKVF